MQPRPQKLKGRNAVRVGIVVFRFPSLSATFVIDQVAVLRNAGLDVHVFAQSRDESGLRHARGRELVEIASFAEQGAWMRLANSRFVPGRYRHRLRQLALRRFYREAARRADLLLCHFGPVGKAVVEHLTDTTGAPPIWTIFHGYDLSAEIERRGADIYAPLFRAGDRFLPISRFWSNRLVELGCPADRIRLLRMGVDCSAIPFAPAPHFEGEPVRILSVGRLVEKKGTEFALRALGEVKERSPEVEWTLDIIGEGPLMQDLWQIARDSGIEDRVEFLGGLSAQVVRSKLAAAHIFVLPSVVAANGDMEGIPVALMEAMAAGAAVASTYHSGIPELVEHGVSGLLAPERDVAKLAKNLAALITEPSLRHELAAAARAKVEIEFNQERLARDLVELIHASEGLGVSGLRPPQIVEA